MGTAKQTDVGIRNKDASKIRMRNTDVRWLYADTNRRQMEANDERRERNRRLAERDAEYAKAFPHLVKRGKMAHDVYNDPMADLRRRCVW